MIPTLLAFTDFRVIPTKQKQNRAVCSACLDCRRLSSKARVKWAWLHPIAQCLPRLVAAAVAHSYVGQGEGATAGKAPARTDKECKECQGTQVHPHQGQKSRPRPRPNSWVAWFGLVGPAHYLRPCLCSAYSFCDTLFVASPFRPSSLPSPAQPATSTLHLHLRLLPLVFVHLLHKRLTCRALFSLFPS